MTILAFDIGNTHTSLAIFRGGVMLSHWKTVTGKRAATRHWKEVITLSCVEADIAPGDIGGCVISSVVPGLTKTVSAAVRKAVHRPPLIVSGSMALGVKTRYEQPGVLGPDRACAIAAAYRKYGGPVIVVDCGTAVTFDPVTRSGIHAGGLIAPGLTLSASALGRGTAALPTTGWEASAPIVGTNTAGAIRAGVLYGVAGGIREITGRLKKKLGGRALVVGTGGDAAVLHEGFSLFDAVDPHLVLEGACIIHRNETRRPRPRTVRQVTSSRRGGSR